jgi:hypothetical protein
MRSVHQRFVALVARRLRALIEDGCTYDQSYCNDTRGDAPDGVRRIRSEHFRQQPGLLEGLRQNAWR